MRSDECRFPIGLPFGMTVRAADSPEEWERCVETARACGGVDIGDTTRTDYDIVIDSPRGIVFVNPSRAGEIMQRMRDAIPDISEKPRPAEAEPGP